MISKIESLKELVRLNSENEYIIFGTGVVCNQVMHYITHEQIKYPQKFVVTNLNGNVKELFGKEVVSIADLNVDTNTPILICTRENIQGEIIEALMNHNPNISIIRMSNLACDYLSVLFGESIYHLQMKVDDVDSRIRGLENALVRMTPMPRLQYFILNINDHCNLNCKGCNHFSSIADKKNYPIETIKKDLIRMKEVHGDIPRIGIMGGEPLLHPDIEEILLQTRKIFPKTEILLSTNGLLCKSMSKEFWELCKNNSITIRFTVYPIALDYEELADTIREYGVKVDYFLGGMECNHFNSLGIDTDGRQNPTYSFSQCEFANQCVFLKEGKLYTCQTIPNIEFFNKEFQYELPIEEGDYIDIYKCGKEETLKRLATPAPFCRFCDISKRKSHIYEWAQTERLEEEWT